MIGRILPIIIILISIGLFVMLINPIYTQEVLPLQAQVKQYDSALTAAADFKKREIQLTNERNAIPADSITRLETFLPDGVDNVQLILDLNALAARSGVQLSNFDIRDATAPASSQGTQSGALSAGGGGNQPTDSLDLSVKATGTYSAFRTFLSGAEASLRLLDLTSLSVKDSQTGVYTYTMTFRIYWLH